MFKSFCAGFLLLLVISLPSSNTLPLSKSKGLFITPGNIRYLASFLHPTITTDNRIIHFGTGSAFETVLRVPLAEPGELDLYTSVRITVGMKPPGNVDKDPRIGLSDGVNNNFFVLSDNQGNPPCFIFPLTSDENRLTSFTPETQTSQFVLLFEPFHQYGACSSAQEHGFVNTGTFPQQLDLSKGLDFIVQRDSDLPETYDFYYFIIEFL